jgi:hypothetical protein
MRESQMNRLSTIGLVVLSLTALLMLLPVAARAIMNGHMPPPDADEGTAAHIFQLSIAALVPTGVVFLATADWNQPLGIVRRLAIPAAAVVLAFTFLYVWEHPQP